jgi:cyclic pyranopterin phosphate synthase
MRDVSAKTSTLRSATAVAEVRMSAESVRLLRDGIAPKGDPLPVARTAAIQAAKDTPRLIPYCHHVPLDYVGVEFELLDSGVRITSKVRAVYKTGVEMEAFVAASVAALTVVDMLKIVDEDLEIASVRLVEKRGGKSDARSIAKPGGLVGAVLVVSDSVSAGESEDRSGALLSQKLESEGVRVHETEVVPDDLQAIESAVRDWIDRDSVNLVITTGGTGVGPRDVTPEAVAPLLERRLEGVEEALRAHGQTRTPLAMLGRTVAGTRGKSVIVCLPGSPAAVEESFPVLFPYLLHAFAAMTGMRHEQGCHSGDTSK